MNTPAHLLFGAALFGGKSDSRTMGAALFGALLPDLSLYVMAGWALRVQQIPPQVVFDELYFSESWQRVFAIDNSILLWALCFFVALRLRSPVGTAFAASGVLHLVLDLLVHAGDGRPHFWPVSDWVFHAPISYWDSSHGAWIIAPLSLAACVCAFVRIWSGSGWPMRCFAAVLLAAEVWVARQWILFF